MLKFSLFSLSAGCSYDTSNHIKDAHSSGGRVCWMPGIPQTWVQYLTAWVWSSSTYDSDYCGSHKRKITFLMHIVKCCVWTLIIFLLWVLVFIKPCSKVLSWFLSKNDILQNLLANIHINMILLCCWFN